MGHAGRSVCERQPPGCPLPGLSVWEAEELGPAVPAALLLARSQRRRALPACCSLCSVVRDISSRESVRRCSPSQKASETCLYKEKLMYGFFFVFNELNTINSSRGFTLTTCSYTQFAHNLCVINIPIHYYSMCTHRNLY